MKQDMEPEENEVTGRGWWGSVSMALLAGALLVFAFIQTRPLMDTSEARYAEVAREMSVEGHWLVPHLGGRPHLTKPPLTYWMVAASQAAFGGSEWASRLPIGLCALATVIVTALCARSMFGPRAGIFAAWLQALALVPLAASNVVTTDTPLSLFEAGAFWCAWPLLTHQLDRGSQRRWQIGFYVFLAAAVLTKGQAGLIVLAGLALFLLRNWSEVRVRALWSPLGLVLFLAIVLPWPLYVLVHVPHAVQVWREEIITNVLEESDHAFPRWGWLALLAFGSFPANVGVFMDLRHWRQSRDESDRLARGYLACWIVGPLLVLSLQKTRLALYVLPLFPALSIWGARGLERAWARAAAAGRSPRRIASVVVIVYALVCLAGKLYYGATAETREARRTFSGVAAIIRHAAEGDTKDTVVYTTEGRLGYGLMYYLNSSRLVRIGMKSPTGEELPPRRIDDILTTSSTAGSGEFLVLEPKKAQKLRLSLQNAWQLVGRTPAYEVYKRRSTDVRGRGHEPRL